MEQLALERVDKMKAFLCEEVNDLKEERLKKMHEQLANNIENISNDLEESLKRLALKESLGSLMISYLKSSYITGSHEFHIAFYTGELFVEEEPDCIYFSMRSLFKMVEEDFEKMDKELAREFFRLIAAEKEEIHRWYMEQLYRGFGTILRPVLENMVAERGKKVYFGGFMDEFELLGEI